MQSNLEKWQKLHCPRVRKLGVRPFLYFLGHKTSWLFFSDKAFRVQTNFAKNFVKICAPLLVGSQGANSNFVISKKANEILLWANKNKRTYERNTRKSTEINFEDVFERAIITWKFGNSPPGFLKLIIKNRSAQLSYLVELAWYIKQAGVYLNEIKKSSKGSEFYKIIKTLERDERDHYKSIIQEIGITEKELDAHYAAPGTYALIAYLRDLGTRDLQSFLVISALFESDYLEKDAVEKLFHLIQSNTKVQTNSFVHHFSEDIKLKHGSLWKKAIRNKSLSVDRAEKILSDLHTARHVIMLWKESLSFRMKEASDIGTNFNVLKPKTFLRERFNCNAFIYDNKSR